jgi:hypothetical protein
MFVVEGRLSDAICLPYVATPDGGERDPRN